MEKDKKRINPRKRLKVQREEDKSNFFERGSGGLSGSNGLFLKK
jgi:hypothetical protein